MAFGHFIFDRFLLSLLNISRAFSY
jgi:hypothetical protein